MLRNLINKIISNLKNEEFVLDKNIPYSYLLKLLARRFIFLLYGFILFRSTCRVFLHTNTTIRCKEKINFGTNLNIDKGCYIDALSINGIKFEKNVSVGKFTCIECTGSLLSLGSGLTVGNNVGLGTHGFWGCAGGISIGNDCIFGNYISLHSENHIFSDLEIPIRLQGVTRKGIVIGSNCWIGSKVTILDGTVLGNGCIVAAGAVVRGKFEDNSIIGGVPARLLKSRA